MGRPLFRPMRILAVAALALAGTTLAVRSAVVNDTLEERPALAAKVWPDHPRVMIAQAMAAIGTDAAAGRPPSAATVAMAMHAARRAPLAIEPFLIGGAVAQSEGRQDVAEPMLVEARRRDPRSGAARFLLAQRYLSSGRPAEGLRETAVLVRMTSGAGAALVPALAQYAGQPAAAPALRRMFAASPEVRDLVLADLSRDAGNYATILSLAGTSLDNAGSAATPAWQPQLVNTLLANGEVERAHRLWLRISGERAAPVTIFNPNFARSSAPPPFNWTFSSGDFGVAEPAGASGLEVIYYGRGDALFASQTLLLAPGVYRLAMQVKRAGGSAGASKLSWSVACLPPGTPLLVLPLGAGDNEGAGAGAGASRTIAGRFTVPAGCASQSIRLAASAGDVPAADQVTISNMILVRQPS